MSLNRREFFKSGAAGLLVGFLFRGRGGELSEEPEVVEQPPSAVTIRCVPQVAFRPSRLVIAGTVVGKQMVPETQFVLCPACGGRSASEDDWNTSENDYRCEACDGLGGSVVETGEVVERDLVAIPWIVENLKIGAADQLVAQGEAIPGDMFSVDAVDSFIRLDAATAGQEINVVVRYTGDRPDGEVFRGALIGTVIDGSGASSRVVMPISSVTKIVA